VKTGVKVGLALVWTLFIFIASEVIGGWITSEIIRKRGIKCPYAGKDK
jgi:hypothetical protein